MLLFAHDGSLNGDFVARYALHWAEASQHRLRVLHVTEDEASFEPTRARLTELAERAGVALEVEVVPRRGASVAQRLLEHVPADPASFLVCGARRRPHNALFFGKTVSAELFARAPASVVAVRVVHPGTLGAPDRVLLPLGGHPRGAAQALPFLCLLGSSLRHVQVLWVREVSRFRYRSLGPESVQRFVAEGRRFLEGVERELVQELGPRGVVVDGSVVLSDDAPKEIAIFAGNHRSRLICLGASERSRTERFLYGSPIEQVLRLAPCDVAIVRRAR